MTLSSIRRVTRERDKESALSQFSRKLPHAVVEQHKKWFNAEAPFWGPKPYFSNTVFENHRKSLIQYCERSELRLHFEWTNVHEKCQKWSIFESLKSFLKGQKLLKNAKNWKSKRDILIFVWIFLDTLLTFGAVCFVEVLEDMKKCKFFPHPQNEWTMEIVN